jgi:hypothetical protein
MKKKYRWNQRHQTSTTLAYLPLPCASSIKKGIFVCANIGFFLAYVYIYMDIYVISNIAMRLINQGYFLLPKTPDLNDLDMSSTAMRLINQAFCFCMYMYRKTIYTIFIKTPNLNDFGMASPMKVFFSCICNMSHTHTHTHTHTHKRTHIHIYGQIFGIPTRPVVVVYLYHLSCY